MINKVHFGKRIAKLRRDAKLSQAELAEKLGVTSQACSKWECGTALPDIELLLELSHLFGITINEMLEDYDLIAELSERTYTQKGINYFVPEEERNIWFREWADDMIREKWVERNWKEIIQDNKSNRIEIGKNIARQGGIILEIGAGPGGGHMPFILREDLDATIIVSDLSPTVVNEWKNLLDKELESPNIYYAAMDFCNIPFKDNSVDIVSDGGGISNTIGDKKQALKEIYRVLKPGGMLVTESGFVNKETLAELPKEVQEVLVRERPDVFEDLYEDTVLAGFKKIESVITGVWHTADDESGIADLARELGVNLKFTSYVRYCRK